jgi:hypothetical protein
VGSFLRVVWLVLSTLAMAACAAATRDLMIASSSVLMPLMAAAGTSDMSSGWALPMFLITSSSGMMPAGPGDGCCDDIFGAGNGDDAAGRLVLA